MGGLGLLVSIERKDLCTKNAEPAQSTTQVSLTLSIITEVTHQGYSTKFNPLGKMRTMHSHNIDYFQMMTPDWEPVLIVFRAVNFGKILEWVRSNIKSV